MVLTGLVLNYINIQIENAAMDCSESSASKLLEAFKLKQHNG